MVSGRAAALVLLVVLGGNGVLGCGEPAKAPERSRDTIRYLLPLRDNPVSSTDAAHCFVACQPSPTPQQYVECLSACPGFQKAPGLVCSSTDVPPESVCLTVRKVPAAKEPPPGMVVLAVVGTVALVVGAASLCNISSNQCGMQLPPPK